MGADDDVDLEEPLRVAEAQDVARPEALEADPAPQPEVLRPGWEVAHARLAAARVLPSEEECSSAGPSVERLLRLTAVGAGPPSRQRVRRDREHLPWRCDGSESTPRREPR